MGGKANSVNIKNYHHGDLRSALVRAGLEQLKNRPVDAISLREIARSVGVSATAVYRHFPDKQALLAALCAEGAEEIGRLQRAAMQAGGGGKAGFDAVGRAYVRFALANPTLFRLMMTTPHSSDMTEQPLDETSGGMRLLREGVAMLAPPSASDADQRVLAIQSWAIVHGLAMLMLDGQVPPDDALIDEVINGAAIGVR